MNSNNLKLNTHKTEVMPVDCLSRLESVDSECANIGESSVPFKMSVKCLGVHLDRTLSMQQHISNISRASFLDHRHVASVRLYLSQSAATRRVASVRLYLSQSAATRRVASVRLYLSQSAATRRVASVRLYLSQSAATRRVASVRLYLSQSAAARRVASVRLYLSQSAAVRRVASVRLYLSQSALGQIQPD